MGTCVPPGTCLIHGSYLGPSCPQCATGGLPLQPFAGQPYDQQLSSVPREWQRCPVCEGAGQLYDPIMGMCNPGATMQCHRCLGTGTIERPR